MTSLLWEYSASLTIVFVRLVHAISLVCTLTPSASELTYIVSDGALNSTHIQIHFSREWVSEWVEFNAPLDTIQVISEAE